MAELKKVISYRVLLLIVINSIMGTGIYFLPAIGASVAGASSLISWALLSALAIYISMCFAELCSMFPSAGGVYEFCKQAFGRVPSFMVGWLALITGNLTIAMLIIGGISYLLPAGAGQSNIAIMALSVLFLAIFNIIAYRGMKSSAVMLVTFSVITLVTFAMLMFTSFLNIDMGNFSGLLSQPIPVIFLAIFFIAETFFGWESSTFLAGETKNGEKIVPKAIVHGTLIICAIAFLFAFSSMGAMGPQLFGQSSAPLSDLAGFHFGNMGRMIFSLLVYLAIIGAVADWVVSSPRLILSMAKDGLFIPHFSKIHEKYQTPYRAIVLQFSLSVLFVFLGLGSYTTLLHMLVPLLLIMYSAVMVSVVVLRKTKPQLKRHFRTPFGNVGPIIVIVIFAGLLLLWATMTDDAATILMRGAGFLSLGIPVYLLLEIYYNPKFIRELNDIFAYLTLMTERLALPVKVRKQIVHLMGDIRGKAVLEFGCSVGTLTMHLAEEVGPQGKIWATDISKREVRIAQNRIEKKGHNHVNVIHDEQHAYRVHPSVPEINTIVSVGMLGYLQDIETVLKQINQRLKKGSRICFVDYDKFFDIIPNAEWLGSDAKIRSIFKKCGFNISIIRKQGFAWKYIFIYGIKEKEIKR